jgi:hypothetical protein
MPTIIREAKNSVQISSNGFYIFINKAQIKTGQRIGETVYTLNVNKYDREAEGHFIKVCTMFLLTEEYDDCLALLCQLQKRK